jgi:hypothetical protein
MALACSDEPLDLGTEVGGDAAAGGAGGGGPPGGGGFGPPTGGMGGGVEIPDDVMIVPAREGFVAEVLPLLNARCSGLQCHAGPPGPNPADIFFRIYGFPDYEIDALNDEQVDEALADVVEFVNWLEPDQSQLLLKGANLVDHEATPSLFVGTENWNTLIAWIEASVIRPEPPMPDAGVPDAGVPIGDGGVAVDGGMMMGGGGGDGVPCDAVPDPRVIRPQYDFDWYGQQVNPMLLARCASGDGCHGEQSMEHSLWLQVGADECSLRWNMLTALWHVDRPDDVVNARLMTRPLDPRHGGRVVFQGRDDCGFILLKLWLEGTNELPPEDCQEG